MFITDHFRDRGIKRNIFPYWLSFETIDEFTMQKLNQTVKQRISKLTGMMINITPGITVVTTPDRECAITAWKNRVRVVR